MSGIQYRLVGGEDGEQTLTVFLSGGELPVVVQSSHPNFEDILDEARTDYPDADEIRDLADPSLTVAKHLTPLSERVAVAGGTVFFDGDPVESVLTDHILRILEEDGDWRALVNFLEKLAANPVPHSQHRLYGWLSARDFTIADDGDFIAYKGVVRDSEGTLRSLHSGPGIVNGERVNGQLDNTPGNLVEIERSYVEADPAVGCSNGLHAGTFDYAQGYASRGATVAVKVNPRDVVSVPTDSGDEKVRVCRYEVLRIASEEYAAPTISAAEYALGD
jgi:hypothetical protein